MCDIVLPALKKWATDPTVNCVVYQSTPRGGKAFCAGGDVRAVYDSGIAPGSTAGHGIPGDITADFFRTEYIMNYAIARFPKPQVALWDGIVMGGGVGLTAHGRFRVATERTMFAMPETAIGLFPDVGMTFVLPRLTPQPPSSSSLSGGAGGASTRGALGMYLGLTGVRLLGTGDLTCAGLATHRVNSAQIPDLVEALVGIDPAQGPSKAQETVGTTLQRFNGLPDPDQALVLAPNLPAIDRCFGPHHTSVESVVTALESESAEGSPHADWAAKTLKILHKVSPTSLKVTFKLLRDHGEDGVTLAQVLTNEYTVSQRCMRPGGGGKSDFYEGIRAVLVDKGNPPAQWAPTSLGDVTPGAVDEFFEPLELEYRLRLGP